MPIDPTDILGQLERAIGLMPAAFLVIVMLAGPTVAWLLYRFVVQPRTRRYADTSLDVFWICEQCRSANDVHVSQCYSCGLERDVTMAGGIRVLDAGGALLLAPEVGEGTQPAAAPTPAMAQAPAAAAAAQASLLAAAPATVPTAAAAQGRAAVPANAKQVPASPATAKQVPASPATAKPRRLVAVGPGSAPTVAASPPVAASPAAPTTATTPSAPAPPAAKKSRRTPVPVMDPETVSASAVVATPSATSRKRTPKVPTATPPGAEPGA